MAFCGGCEAFCAIKKEPQTDEPRPPAAHSNKRPGRSGGGAGCHESRPILTPGQVNDCTQAIRDSTEREVGMV
jgi:hypothetical protein